MFWVTMYACSETASNRDFNPNIKVIVDSGSESFLCIDFVDENPTAEVEIRFVAFNFYLCGVLRPSLPDAHKRVTNISWVMWQTHTRPGIKGGIWTMGRSPATSPGSTTWLRIRRAKHIPKHKRGKGLPWPDYRKRKEMKMGEDHCGAVVEWMLKTNPPNPKPRRNWRVRGGRGRGGGGGAGEEEEAIVEGHKRIRKERNYERRNRRSNRWKRRY